MTLTGIGGAGKSRVATLVATAAEDAFTDVAYLQVTEATTAAQLAVDVALSLGRTAGGDLRDSLAELGPERRALVVLDNLEALADGADLVRSLLGASEALTLLVTSRLPLSAAGERVLPVPPLEVPEPTAAAATIGAAASVLLFADRAASAESSFVLEGQEHAVAEVCGLLDGLPLAIELAAARVGLRSLDRIIDELRAGLDLLSSGPMATAIRWSYDRLDAEARLVCDRLALFERGFTIEAVEAVCLDVPSVVERLAAIVDARLVRPMESRVEVRFVVLGTVRAFARAQLLAHPDLVRSRELLAGHLTSRVESSADRLYGPDADLTLARFDDDAADIAATIEWALDAGRRGIAVELTLASLDCWISAGRHNEALARTRAVLEHVPQQGPDAARLHAAVGLLAYHLTDFDAAQEHSRLALDLAERHDDRRSAAFARTFLGATLVFRGELAEGSALAEDALAEAEALDLYPLSAQALQVLAMAMAMRGDVDGERQTYEALLGGGAGQGRPGPHRRHDEHPGRDRARRGRRRDGPGLRAESLAIADGAAADGESGRGHHPGAGGAGARRPARGGRPAGSCPGAQRPARPELRRGAVPARRWLPGRGPRRRRHRRPALRRRPRGRAAAGRHGPAAGAGPRGGAGRGPARAGRQGRRARLDHRQRPAARGRARAAGGGARRLAAITSPADPAVFTGHG